MAGRLRLSVVCSDTAARTMAAQVQPIDSERGSDGGGDVRSERRRRPFLAGRALSKLASVVGGGNSDTEDEAEAIPALPPTAPRAASEALMAMIDVAESFVPDAGRGDEAVDAWMVSGHTRGVHPPCTTTVVIIFHRHT